MVKYEFYFLLYIVVIFDNALYFLTVQIIIQMEFTKMYGPIWKERLGTLEFVNVASPDLVEALYRNEGKYPSRLDMKPWKTYRTHRNEAFGLLTL